jgi:hypothetical protein
MAGPECSKDVAVVLHPHGGDKLVMDAAKKAKACYRTSDTEYRNGQPAQQSSPSIRGIYEQTHQCPSCSISLYPTYKTSLFAEDGPGFDDMMVKKSFLILKSTPDYNEALVFARRAAKELGLKLDLRNLSKNDQTGLTFPKEECEEEGWEFPCYVARGRYDDGSFVSVEYSSSFEGFSQGLYIVLAAGGNEETARTLKLARKYFPDAYAKISRVYVGCIH